MVLHYANAPRAAVLTLLMISIFLYSFVMTGCMHTSSVFSSLYILKFSYNQDSHFFKHIENGSIVQHPNGTFINQSDLSVRTGVMGICTQIGPDLRCTNQNVNALNLSEIHPVYNITLPTVDGQYITENILQNAIDFASKEIYAILLITLILMGLAFTSILFVSFFLVPANNWKTLIGDVSLFGAALFALISCVMMSRDALTAKKSFGNTELVIVRVGKKAAAMYWIGLTFLGICLILLRVMRYRLEDEIKIEKAKKGMRA